MARTGQDTLNVRRKLTVDGKTYDYFSLKEAAEKIGDISELPFSLKVLLENLLRFEDGKSAIFIDENNYKQKFEEYLVDNENSKWEKIANEGRNHALNNLNNDKATDALVEIMQELVC